MAFDVKANKSRRLNYTIWNEKFRIVSIADAILPTATRTYFEKILSDKELPNMLFTSNSPGTCKTSIARALCDQLEYDYIYINVSKDNGIDTLRTTIDKFAATLSMDGNKKAVILDEFDGASLQLQKALRASIEEFQAVCRFIITCNYHTQIIPAIKSRCEEVDFNYASKQDQDEMKPKMAARLCGILKYEKIEFDPAIITELVNDLFPDMRKMLGLLQQYSKQANVIDRGIFTYETIDDELYNLILNKKVTAARKFIMEKSYDYDELYSCMFNDFVPKLDKSKQSQVIITLAQYQHMSATSIDKELCFSACMLEVIGVL